MLAKIHVWCVFCINKVIGLDARDKSLHTTTWNGQILGNRLYNKSYREAQGLILEKFLSKSLEKCFKEN